MGELIIFENGTLADAAEVNANFRELASRITQNAENLTEATSYLQSSITNINTVVDNTLSIYQDINVLDTSGELTLACNNIYSITPTDEITFELPEVTDNTKYNQILVQLKLDDTSFISASNEGLGTDYFFNGIIPVFEYEGYYDIIYSYDSSRQKWCVGALYKGDV